MGEASRGDAPLAPAAVAPGLIAPGLVVLHGNRLEWLKEAVIDWTARQPLGVLEEDVFLVQSNGIAEWLKMALAERLGVCAATRVELPARFLWRTYRALLGREGAPATAPLDKGPMVWRLMRVLGEPALHDPVFAPLHRFLEADLLAPPPGPGASSAQDARRLSRRLQLARRLADLFDQYQVYRADWLTTWAGGRDLLSPGFDRPAQAVPTDQAWQPALWRVLLADLQAREGRGEETLRPAVHARFVGTLGGELSPAQRRRLPRRVIAFGMSHLPWQTLEALAALSRHSQVVLAVPNPCRYHWADIIEGRELLRFERRRFGLREGRDLAALSLPQAHAQAHPLLAAWGRQGRDFIRLLDAFDDAAAVRERLPMARIDLFDASEADPGEEVGQLGVPLLHQVQAAVRDLLPLAEHPHARGASAAAADGSIVFHLAHSAVREVEILHDQLLQRLGRSSGPDGHRLTPRDIVVMVPDIEPWAPLIHAVFGQHAQGDTRRIPYEITDLRPRGRAPLMVALEWLLRIDQQRCTASELRDLLDVPAVARRFGLAEEDRALAARWLEGAGVRWGLNAEHRDALGLGAVGEQNTWAFGLRRMIAGYACGPLGPQAAVTPGREVAGAGRLAGIDAGPGLDAMDVTEGRGSADADAAAALPWQGIDPYDEVGGLDAAVAGSLDALVQRLLAWWRLAREPATPAVWDERARALLTQLFAPADESERLLVAALQEALGRWRETCRQAGFDDQAVPLAVLREAWLDAVDEPGLRSRFLAGGVVFCTLMPMRAIPFRVVCLLGMNEGDYPRRAPRSDFDLLGLPGQRRPGDRARRDDDRMLMLEALLAARDTLYLSWAGRSVRDNSAQPPSVLVAQLRDYLAAGWGERCVAEASLEHPLQPFSRRYFGLAPAMPGGVDIGAAPASGPLFTYAREWRDAHDPVDPGAKATAGSGGFTGPIASAGTLDLKRLGDFLRQPVQAYFRDQLGVQLRPLEALAGDDEPLGLSGLDEHGLLARLLAELPGSVDWRERLRPLLQARTAAMARRGELPVGAIGERWQARFLATSEPMCVAWQAERALWPQAAQPLPLRVECTLSDGRLLVLDDWLDGLREAVPAAATSASDLAAAGGAPGTLMWLTLDARRLCRKPGGAGKSAARKAGSGTAAAADPDAPGLEPDPAKLLMPWLHLLVASAAGLNDRPLAGCIVGRDAVLHLTAPAPAAAREVLDAVLKAWHLGHQQPLRVAQRTAIAWLLGHAKALARGRPEPVALEAAYDLARTAYAGSFDRAGECEEPVLARLFDDAEALLGDPEPKADGTAHALADSAPAVATPALGDFVHWAQTLYGPLVDWCATRVVVQALPMLDDEADLDADDD